MLRRLVAAALLALGAFAAPTSAIVMPMVAGDNTAGYVNLNGRTINSSVGDPADAEAGYRLDQDGKIYQRTAFGGAFTEIVSDNWILPHSDTLADYYESRATLTAGTCTTGTMGTWEALTADRTWTKTQTVIGSSSCTFLLEIRIASGGSAVAFATITLSADVS